MGKSDKSSNRFEKGLKKIGELIIPSIGALIAFSGFCIFVYQIYLYLRNGEWLSLSTLDAIRYTESESRFYNWLVNPEDWIGVSNLFYKILSYMPLSIVIVSLGIFIIKTYYDAKSNSE